MGRHSLAIAHRGDNEPAELIVLPRPERWGREALTVVPPARFGDDWIGDRIALDARISLLEQALDEIDEPARACDVGRLVREIAETAGAIAALVDAVDAARDLGSAREPLARYVGHAYVWCADAATAIDGLAASGSPRAWCEAVEMAARCVLEDLEPMFREAERALRDDGVRESAERAHAQVACTNREMRGGRAMKLSLQF